MSDLAATAPAAVPTGPRAYKLPRNLSRRLGRSDRSQLAIWFWELDRVLLALMLMLIAIGLIAVQAASPATNWQSSVETNSLSAGRFVWSWMPMILGLNSCAKTARRLKSLPATNP